MKVNDRMIKLTRKQARRLMIGSQLLSGPAPKRPTRRKMLQTIQQLGAVQIDSISVVARSHHIVLWSRLGKHPPDWLNDLLSDERAIFEYWTHAAAYSPIELYPYFRRAMLGQERTSSKRALAWKEENADVLVFVLEHVRANGSVSARTFDAPDGAEKPAPWAWYGNKPTNLALEMLWSDGVVMVDRRESFTRFYDLTEVIHPDWDDRQLPTLEAERLFLAKKTVEALGVTTARWLPDYFRMRGWRQRANGQTVAQSVLEHLVETGDAKPATIEGIDEPAYVATNAVNRRYRPSRTTVLSPFDSLVWDRTRTEELWDFELRLEAYTPRDKRQYGYFCLPILHRDRLVGRLDPKVDRRSGVLTINSLHLELWFTCEADDRFYDELGSCLWDFAAFNEADEIVLAPEIPGRISSPLTSALRQATKRPA